jgi:hypothetical protein
MGSFLRNLFGRREEKHSIIVVSGLPRSGTSLMMKMLEAGGVPLLTDAIRQADEDNPQGYYEFERVKGLDKGDVAWLPTAQGKGVKVISALLRYLPPTYTYRILFLERDLDEILASQRKMLARRHPEPAELTAEEMAEDDMAAVLTRHLHETRRWLDSQSNMTTLYVSYRELLQAASPQLRQIQHFLAVPLDTAQMLGVIDPSLYRNRQR